jgi:hypothetical protein
MKNYTLTRNLEMCAMQAVKEKDDWQGMPEYIHLKDAKFHNGTGEGLSKQKGVFWRGQIDKVSGFHLG